MESFTSTATEKTSLQSRLVELSLLHQEIETLQAKLVLMHEEYEQNNAVLLDELTSTGATRVGDFVKVDDSTQVQICQRGLYFYNYKTLTA